MSRKYNRKLNPDGTPKARKIRQKTLIVTAPAAVAVEPQIIARQLGVIVHDLESYPLPVYPRTYAAAEQNRFLPANMVVEYAKWEGIYAGYRPGMNP
jgi:hypothetical protein